MTDEGTGNLPTAVTKAYDLLLEEPIRVMPFCYGERSTGICFVLGPQKSSTYCREYAFDF